MRIGSVEKAAQRFTLRTLGRVAADETRVYRINAAVDGWIRKTFDNATGSLVKKNERIATFYSPDFLSAEQAYIYALNSLSRFRSRGKERPSQISLTRLNVQQYKDTLSNLGMGDLQIKKLARTLVYTENIDITSPVTGFILARSVSPGERFEKGREMYRIADLRHVWILADLFEKEPYDLAPGTRVKVSVPYQKRAFEATVSDILPVFDGPSRTLKVRMETDNPGYFLRPDMFVDIEIPMELPTAIRVPADAVLDSGLKKTVYVHGATDFSNPGRWRQAGRSAIGSRSSRGSNPASGSPFPAPSSSTPKAAWNWRLPECTKP